MVGGLQKGWIRSSVAGIIVLLLMSLLIQAQPTARAADNGRRLLLSASSGPTGVPLTITGSGFKAGEVVRLSMVNRNRVGELIFGYASIRTDGTFNWRGLLGRSSYYNRGRGEDPGIFTAPIGPVDIVAFPTDVAPSIDAGADTPFNVTDNSKGPNVTEKLAYYGNSSVFRSLWGRTDLAVSTGEVSRSWLWGPYEQGNGVTTVLEPYTEGVGGWRWVAYFDKARMEITQPIPNISAYYEKPYYVTNGLLVKEMVTGQLQTGDTRFENKGSAGVPAAGDLSGPNATPNFGMYAALQSRNDNADNKIIVQTLTARGDVQADASLASYNVHAVNLVKETNHYIASPFWDYLNSTGPIINEIGRSEPGRLFDPLFYATGYPITEAFWTKTTVGGQEKTVLVQLFERRVLTYTPSNPAAYRVEMGNVGLQYFEWRYGKRN